MSTAAAFVYPRSFPFCVTDISGSPGGADYIGNLTLAEVMVFYWNIENVSFATVGTATKGTGYIDGTHTSAMNPVSSTFFDEGSVDDGGWFTTFGDTRAFASWPSINPPRSRICMGTQLSSQSVVRLNMSLSTDPGFNALQFSFNISTDPSNSGRYRLYYLFLISYIDHDADVVEIRWQNPSLSSGALAAITTGTFSLGGFTFDYGSWKTSGASHTDGTMSTSSSSYTY